MARKVSARPSIGISDGDVAQIPVVREMSMSDSDDDRDEVADGFRVHEELLHALLCTTTHFGEDVGVLLLVAFSIAAHLVLDVVVQTLWRRPALCA
jgi:hypothetical protein